MTGYSHSCAHKSCRLSRCHLLFTTVLFPRIINHQYNNTMFGQAIFSGTSLDAAGLVALADLSTIANRTATIGSASLLDILFLAPGIHRHQKASEVNFGEQPATASLTTGYRFQIENPATVNYMQKVGVTGHLVNIYVEQQQAIGIWNRYCLKGGVLSSVLFLIGPMLTLAASCFMGVVRDWWGLGIILALIFARLLNVIVIRRRSTCGWKGRFFLAISQLLVFCLVLSPITLT